MANISRNSFDESKDYDKVILQQGAPITDYDYNEAQDIQRAKIKNIIKEAIGDGAIEDGLRVIKGSGANVDIKPGVIYVKGYRIRLSVGKTVNIPVTNNTYKVYMGITEQEIDSLADPNIKHPKLSIEPTRRIKVTFDIQSGTAVPADTATTVYYLLADVVVSGGVISTVTDKRAIRVNFNGADGFTIKTGVNLGETETDVLNFKGRIRNNGATFGGKIYIDDTVHINESLHVKDRITSDGLIAQVGKLYQVASIPLFGIAGDLQYQSDSTVWEDVTPTLYKILDISNGHFPAAASGMTRQYRFRIAYSQDNAASTVSVRLVDSATSTISMQEITLPKFAGEVNGSRRYHMSTPFAQGTSPTDYKIQAKVVGGGSMAIYNVELIAYDVLA